jgi:hypothetical protein
LASQLLTASANFNQLPVRQVQVTSGIEKKALWKNNFSAANVQSNLKKPLCFCSVSVRENFSFCQIQSVTLTNQEVST